MPAESSPSANPSKVILGCSKCGATLPDDAQFCLQCGKPVSSPAKSPTLVEPPPPAAEPVKPKRKRRYVLWTLLVLLFLFVAWAVLSDNPFAQAIQESIGWKQDRIILDSSFVVGPHTFRYYKFALPEGSVNVSVLGQFKATASPETSKTKSAADAADNNVEVFVITEAAFTVWQNGYATSSLYESGKVSEGNVQAEVPAGAGIYYLIFSNRASPKTPKSVHATVLLRYKSWLPDSLRRGKARLSDWLGLN